MPIDIPTLFITAALIIAFFGVMLIAQRSADQSTATAAGEPCASGPAGAAGLDPLVCWGASMLCGAGGMALAAAGAGGFIEDALARAIMLLGSALGWLASAVFAARPHRSVLVMAGPVAWLLAHQLAPAPLRPLVLIVVPCLIGAAYAAASGYALWQGRAEPLRSRRVAYLLMFLHATLYGLRALAAVVLPGAVSRVIDAVVTVLLFEAILHTVGMAFVLLAMSRERAELITVRSVADARDAAQAASEARLRFIARLSHELRTPLHGVLGLAQVIAADGDLTRVQRDHAETMTRAGRHLLSLVNDVLDLARIDAGEMALEAQPTSLAALVGDCVALVRGQAEDKALLLETDFVRPVPRAVLADATRLRQILLNLLGNAVKFTPAGGLVRLRVSAPVEGFGLRFEVQDTGPGVPADKRGELFKDYARIVTAAGGAGAGLGLSISAALAHRMGGTIGFSPGRDGLGSIFWVELPLLTAAAADAVGPVAAFRPAIADRHAEPLGAERLRVLVVDDQGANQRLARAILEGAGHHVALASSGAEAMRRIGAEAPFDVVLMDLHMQGSRGVSDTPDGIEATRRLRAHPCVGTAVPIIGLTAETDPTMLARCRAAGMDDVLVKPVEPRLLLQRVLACGPRVQTAAAATAAVSVSVSVAAASAA